jgi:hypothetical protein
MYKLMYKCVYRCDLQAKITCEKLRGQMAVLGSAEVVGRLNSLPSRSLRPYEMIWAGYTDNEKEGDFRDVYNNTIPPRRVQPKTNSNILKA